MPYNDSIKQSLNIIDPNLNFPLMCFSTEKRKGKICSFYTAYLTYVPLFCDSCGAENKDTIHKWGRVKSDVAIPRMGVNPSFVRLYKQRFKCDSCNSRFTAKTGFVDSGCYISNLLRIEIAQKLSVKISMTDIAKELNISTSTVYRSFNKYYEDHQINQFKLPEVLCFDEFKSVRNVAGSMSFVMMDWNTKKLVDIVSDRRLPQLRKYFERYTPEARKMVKFVAMDMYRPYMTLVKEMFPNAEIILDRFHIIQHLSRAFSITRIQIMNRLKKTGSEGEKQYRRLKRYWKLLQKDSQKLNYSDRVWHSLFKRHVTETDIIDELLGYDDELKRHYDVYQDLLFAFHHNDYDEFIKLIDEKYHSLNYKFKTVFNTFKKNRNFIKNSLKHKYSNGPLECFNNHIKVIKRIAYGYRNYSNFKKRILIVFGNQPMTIKKAAPHDLSCEAA
ncbi:MAG: ISL3 family transposase [Lactobacillales bacterium]|jgi:transposase|nr:ISL3 family transposase [Lactobacillales bacterium]